MKFKLNFKKLLFLCAFLSESTAMESQNVTTQSGRPRSNSEIEAQKEKEGLARQQAEQKALLEQKYAKQKAEIEQKYIPHKEELTQKIANQESDFQKSTPISRQELDQQIQERKDADRKAEKATLEWKKTMERWQMESIQNEENNLKKA